MDSISIELDIDKNKLEIGPDYENNKWECLWSVDGSVERVFQHVSKHEVTAAAFREIFGCHVDSVSVGRI